MCGIAGHVGARQLETGRIERCLRLMHHRGPDHAAYRRLVDPAGRRVDLLSTRLKIIDLEERSNQPFHLGTKWLVHNGELYNYVELRAELRALGHAFTTESDTEVLLRTLDHFGWDGLDRCEGMWAFAVYDEADGSLTLCRDRFGEKPLYVYRDGEDLYFGSEVKFVAELLGEQLAVDLDHVVRYLVNGYKALYKEPRAFFTGLEELPPASWLRLDPSGREDRRTYWTPCFRPRADMSRDEAIAGVRERLIRAVEIRLRADVPLAFCMSGGVDSNSLISIAKRVFDYDVHGFTIVNTDRRYDEQDMVDQAVAAQRLRHTAVPLSVEDFLPRLRTLVRQHDAPVYTVTYYTHWLLMESIAAQGYRISLSGTGADELFTGYYDHHLMYLAEAREDPARAAAARRSWERHVLPFVRNPHLRDPDLFASRPGFRDHIFFEAASFAAYLTEPWEEPFAERDFTDSPLRNRMLNEMFHENVPVILHEDDLNAMYFSIENRSPYLDRQLFEFAFSIPSRHLIADGFGKVLLREAMRGIVPDRILDNRRKVGFNAPIFALLDARDPAVRASVLGESPIYEHVRRERIAALLDRRDLPNSESKFLFYFLSAKIFLEEFGA